MSWVVKILVALFLSTSAATAQNARAELRGYANLSFGMREDEAKKTIAFSRRVDEKIGVRLYAEKPVEIEDHSYTLSARFVDGKLETILLSGGINKDPANLCLAHWRRTIALLQTKYGPPDLPVGSEGYSDTGSIDRYFTFKDGNRITALSHWMPGFCLVNVVYTGRKGKDTF